MRQRLKCGQLYFSCRRATEPFKKKKKRKIENVKGVFCTEETLTVCAANVCLFQSSSSRRTLYDGERIPEIVQTKHEGKKIFLLSSIGKS